MKILKKPLFTLIIVLSLIGIFKLLDLEYDLTKDKRYSLSKRSISKLVKIDEPIRIDVFLEGNLPNRFIGFRNQLDALLSQLQKYSGNIILNYNNPYEFGDSEDVIEEMQRYGMTPEIVFENTNGNRKESIIFPWIILNVGEHSERVSLLSKQLGDTENKKIVRSLQQLEFKIMEGLHKVTLNEKPNLAILTSHQTSEQVKLADLLKSLRSYYNLASFDLKTKGVTKQAALENLKRFDGLIISNPKTEFTQSEKYILDQYLLNGGGQLWLVDGIQVDIDSLFNLSGKTYGFPRELNLNDYFFNIGIKIKKTIIEDLYCAPIVLANGKNNNTKYIPYPWPFYPLSKPLNTSLIGKDVGTVISQFASPLDTINTDLNKTILMRTSEYTKSQGPPVLIELEKVTLKINPSIYNESSKILGILIEGKNKSLFYNRVKPLSITNIKNEGIIKMIVFGDGNLAENQTEKGFPLTLGFDKWTNNFYGNKTLVMNAIHHLMDNKELLSLRKKNWEVAFLDKQKINKTITRWKGFVLLTPLFFIICTGWVYRLIRSKHL